MFASGIRETERERETYDLGLKVMIVAWARSQEMDLAEPSS